MTADAITGAAVWLALAILGIAFLLTVWRVIKGPTLPDRVVALDMLVGIAIGFIALIAIRTGFTLYIDIAISLGLVGFLATVAFARFIMSRPVEGEDIAVVEKAILSAPRKKPKQTAARGRIKPSTGSEPGGDTPKPSKKSGRRKGGA